MSPFVRAQAVRPNDRTLAAAVFCLLFAFYLGTFAGLPENPDSEVEFQSTSALVRGQTLALGGTSEAEAIVGLVHQGRQGFNVRAGGPGREGEYFSWSGVGQPLLAFPLYITGALVAHLIPDFEERHAGSTHLGVARSEYFEHLFVGLRNPLLGALTGALLVLASRRAGARRVHAVACGISYGLCTYAWPQARGTLSDVQATALLFLAFVLAQGIVEALQRGRAPGLPALLGFGTSLGLAFLTRPVLAPAVAVLSLFYVLRVWREGRGEGRTGAVQSLLLGFLPAVASFAGFLWVNHSRFGDPLELGYGGVVGADWFTSPRWIGLVGATVSPGAGLMWFAPGILLALPWFVHTVRRRDYALPGLVAGMVVAIGLVHSIIPSWYGAWSYGPRYHLPLIPFLWFPIGVTLGLVWESVLGRLVVIGLLGLGAITAVAGVLVEYNTNLDLTVQAGRLEWPCPEGENPQAHEDGVFEQAKFDWRLAVPWAHWRILRHRVAGLGERYPVDQLYFIERDAVLEPQWEREKGFRHIAWVDLHKRLGGPSWPGPVLFTMFLVLSLMLFLRAQEPENM